MRGPGFVATIFASLLPSLAAAQLQLSADLGSAALRQTGFGGSGVVTFGADVHYADARASIASSALGVLANDGQGTGQAIVTGALYAPMTGGPRWQIAGSASTFAASNDLPITSAQLTVREFIGDQSRGVFFGAAAGTLGRNRERWPSFVGQGGGWLRVNDDQFLVALSATSTQLLEHADVAQIGDVQVADPASYVDANVGWQRDRAALTFAVTGGARAGIRGVAQLDGWGSATATAWLVPRIALVATAGRALADVVRGVPQTRYASLSVRVALERHASLIDRTSGAASGPRLTLTSSGGVGAPRRIEVRVAADSLVEIMADFTQWMPARLSRVGNVWILERAIDSGPHRIAVRIDGGEWRAPVNLPSADNGFGGNVGLITVP